VSDETYQAHRRDGLFQREENSACRLLIVHVAEQRRHLAALHAAAFDLQEDFVPFVLGLVEIQQAVHATIRALAVAFLVQRVNSACSLRQALLQAYRSPHCEKANSY